MQTEPILETKNLQKRFGSVRAVQGVDLSVRRGEIYGFLGPNGAGKTTTIGMVLGLIYPSAGEVRLFGERVRPGATGALRRVGSLVGAPALEMALTARENLRLAAALTPGLPRGRVEEALEWVGLDPSRGGPADDRPARSFSTGMKQRLGLALALLAAPELLILDEPTNGMDPAGMREIRMLLGSLAAQGMTIFLSSHLLHEVEQICTRVAVLNRGRVVAEGPVSALLSGHSFSEPQVQVRVDRPDRAAALLAGLPGAADIRPNGETLTVRGVRSQEVIRCLAANDIFPHEVINIRPDLESLFMELTTEG